VDECRRASANGDACLSFEEAAALRPQAEPTLRNELFRRRQLLFAGAGAVVGFMLFPLIAMLAPGGSYLAALATGHGDRCLAGRSLMLKESDNGDDSIVTCPVNSPRKATVSDILTGDEGSVEQRPQVGAVPTLPGACPILGDCVLPKDEGQLSDLPSASKKTAGTKARR
jgi:hypothetical protein